jgi:transcriptional regulator with XRE-family HTH domain
MANLIGVGIAQMRRYEKGNSSPTLEVIKNIARTLGVSADDLIFDENERVAAAKILDRKLLEQFEQISKLSAHDKEAVKTILESMIIKGRLEEVMPSRTDATWSKQMRSVVDEFRQGAADFSDDEIESIVDEAVDVVRKAS